MVRLEAYCSTSSVFAHCSSLSRSDPNVHVQNASKTKGKTAANGGLERGKGNTINRTYAVSFGLITRRSSVQIWPPQPIFDWKQMASGAPTGSCFRLSVILCMSCAWVCTNSWTQKKSGDCSPLASNISPLTLWRLLSSVWLWPALSSGRLRARRIIGYKHGEIAKILQCSTGCSKSQLHKARRRLRELLQGESWRGQPDIVSAWNRRLSRMLWLFGRNGSWAFTSTLAWAIRYPRTKLQRKFAFGSLREQCSAHAYCRYRGRSTTNPAITLTTINGRKSGSRAKTNNRKHCKATDAIGS